MNSNDFSIPDTLIAALQQAQHVAILTGAGTSAESGVPTFREAQTGLWAQYNPEELATPQAFQRNPQLVWEWYEWRRGLVAKAEPNPGHHALAALAQHIPQLTLITQNVDGLHQRAGNKHVIELHGNITRTKCFDDGRIVPNWPETGEVPPRCPHCDGLLRPDVVWFGEGLPYDAWATAVNAAQTCDIFFSIGTSGLVQPAASLPLQAVSNGRISVEINPQPTLITRQMNFVLAGPSGEVLPALLTAAWGTIVN